VLVCFLVRDLGFCTFSKAQQGTGLFWGCANRVFPPKARSRSAHRAQNAHSGHKFWYNAHHPQKSPWLARKHTFSRRRFKGCVTLYTPTRSPGGCDIVVGQALCESCRSHVFLDLLMLSLSQCLFYSTI